MKCIIIDDEPLACEELSEELNGFESIEIIGSFGNATKALDFTKNNHVDLVFLDIEMPSINGLELAKQLPANTLFIFTTAYPQFAIDGYELDAIDYLLKPITKDRFDSSVKKYVDFFQMTSTKNQSTYLFVKADGKQVKINFSDLIYIEGLKDYIRIHTKTEKILVLETMKSFEEKLPNHFKRIPEEAGGHG